MKILLLAGGDSSERSVSLNSGRAVYESLKRQDHVVFAIDPVTGKSLLNSDGTFIEDKSTESGKVSIHSSSSSWSLSKTLGSPAFQDIEIVMITMHGGSGEDGMLQSMLELAGKRHTGSGMAASAIAMDKAITKRICISEDIKTARFRVYRVTDSTIDDSIIEEIAEKFDFPMIVKPNDGGSTLGLSKVDEKNELKASLEKAVLESPNILIEQFIKGREITAAVLSGKALPLVEIVPNNGLYDFEAKYMKGKSEYYVPADISDEMTKTIQEAAVNIYNIIGCSGMARADFILDKKNDFYFLELNTLPGMTQLSLAPMAASAAGYGFDELIEQLLIKAIQK